MKTTLNFKTYDGNKKRCYSDMNSDGTITVWTTTAVDFEISCFIDGFSKSFIEMTDKETEEAENIAISKTLKKAITLFKNAENFETVKPYLEMLMKDNEYACFNEIRNSGNAFEIEMITDGNSVNCYIRVCEQFETETAETAEALAEASALILAEAEEAEQAEKEAEAEIEAITAEEQTEETIEASEASESIKAMKKQNNSNIASVAIYGITEEAPTGTEIVVYYKSDRSRSFRNIETATASVKTFIEEAEAVEVGIDYKHTFSPYAVYTFYATEEEAEQAEEAEEEAKARAKADANFYNAKRHLTDDNKYVWTDFYNGKDITYYITVKAEATATEEANKKFADFCNRHNENKQKKAEQAEATAEAEEIAEAIEAAESFEILTAIAEQAEEIARKHNNSAFYINTSIFGKLAEQAKAKAKEYATAEQAEIIAIEEAIEEAETMRYYAEASASAEEIEAMENNIEALKQKLQKKQDIKVIEQAEAEAEALAEAIETTEEAEALTAIAEQAEAIAESLNNRNEFCASSSVVWCSDIIAEVAKQKAEKIVSDRCSEKETEAEEAEEQETATAEAEQEQETTEATASIDLQIFATEEAIETLERLKKVYRNSDFDSDSFRTAEEEQQKLKQKLLKLQKEQEQQKKQKLLKLNMQYFATGTGKRIEAEAEADKNYIVEIETIATGAKKYGICTKAEAIAEANRNDKIIVTVLRRTTAEEEAEEQEQKQKLLKLKKLKQNRKTEEAIEAIKTMFQLFLFWIITATASEQEQQNRQKQKLLKLNMQYFAKAKAEQEQQKKAEQEQQKKKDYKYIMILADNTAYYFTSIKACYKYCKSFMFNFNRHSKTTLKRIDKNSFEITNFIDFKKLYGNNADNFTCVFHIYKINTDKCDIFEINSYNDRY